MHAASSSVSEPATRPVFLLGMMGAGKSTLGPPLAARLRRSFVDTDQWIEGRAGCSIATLFEQRGEAAFRQLECEAIDEAARGGAVVALGGGAVAQPGAIERLLALGTLVYLRASPAVLLERVGEAAERPLLRGLGREERLERLSALLKEREPAYASAQIAVSVEAGDLKMVVEEIAKQVARLEAGSAP